MKNVNVWLLDESMVSINYAINRLKIKRLIKKIVKKVKKKH